MELPCYYVYSVVGYEEEIEGNVKGQVMFNRTTSLVIHADSVEEALKKAKSLIKCKFYHVVGIQEVIDNYSLQNNFKKPWEK